MIFQKKNKTKQKLLDVINYFKLLPFYNTDIEKFKIKHLRNIDLLSELPFYKKRRVVKTNKAFRGYAMTYKVKLIDKKDSLLQLEASKLSIKDFFNDLLDETKGFKYHIIVKILLKKFKGSEIEFYLFFFNSKTKTVINHKFVLEKVFQ